MDKSTKVAIALGVGGVAVFVTAAIIWSQPAAQRRRKARKRAELPCTQCEAEDASPAEGVGAVQAVSVSQQPDEEEPERGCGQPNDPPAHPAGPSSNVPIPPVFK
jgi:hypothetical protein